MRIKTLYRYDEEGRASQRSQLQLDRNGIVGNRPCHPWRQILLVPEMVLEQNALNPADLKENILVEGTGDIHALDSGTVISLGDAALRLTFHCEPCAKLSHLVSARKLKHRRGYLAQVILAGVIRPGDPLVIEEQRFEPIPYQASERIRWYLKDLSQPITAAQLVDEIGLPKSYCRALPGLLRRHPELDNGLIRFASRQKK